jgi:hypothetical protein
LAEGVESGQFRRVDPIQFAVSLTGINVFYFISAPIHSTMGAGEPFSEERLHLRRVNAADMLASTLFKDAEKGRQLAADVLSKWEVKLVKKQSGKVTRK